MILIDWLNINGASLYNSYRPAHVIITRNTKPRHTRTHTCTPQWMRKHAVHSTILYMRCNRPTKNRSLFIVVYVCSPRGTGSPNRRTIFGNVCVYSVSVLSWGFDFWVCHLELGTQWCAACQLKCRMIASKHVSIDRWSMMMVLRFVDGEGQQPQRGRIETHRCFPTRPTQIPLAPFAFAMSHAISFVNRLGKPRAATGTCNYGMPTKKKPAYYYQQFSFGGRTPFRVCVCVWRHIDLSDMVPVIWSCLLVACIYGNTLITEATSDSSHAVCWCCCIFMMIVMFVTRLCNAINCETHEF